MLRSALLLAAALSQACPGAQAQDAAPARGLSLLEAVQAALERNADLLVARTSVDAALGAAQQLQGALDPVLGAQMQQSRAQESLAQLDRAAFAAAGVTAADQRIDSRIGQVSLSRQFANGMQASIGAIHSSLRDNTDALLGAPPQKSGALTFQITTPLLRKPGIAPLGAALDAEVEAATLEQEFAAAQTTRDVALAYWNAQSCAERLRIARASERRSEELLADLRRLVAADEVPRADLQLAQASLSVRRSSRLAAQQSLLDARRALGRLLGLDAASIERLDALSDRPPGTRSGMEMPQADDTQAADALRRRADLAALGRRVQAATLRRESVQEQNRPQLDLVLSATRRGLAESDGPAWLPAFTHRAGPGWGVGLNYQIALGERAALGALRQQDALVQALRVREQDLGAAIESGVRIAAQALQSAAEQLDEAGRAVAGYRATVENERTRRRLGLVTLIEELTVEDRYNDALLLEAQAREGYASAIARWRFETGTLVQRAGARYTSRVDALFDPTVQ
ncbi:MAG TPA: TolC family protein [Ramlibacter sp.]|uniref:TolC family protein n=1 Tax=Ramlibacter sp. TaxID=1917967 RepID=UPI002C06EFCB|nr:TolC family protein [Ramlibacter sp.]HVZ43769.1 TolC family protein [Ramlibacter sp.]